MHFGAKKGTIYAFWRKKRNHLRILGYEIFLKNFKKIFIKIKKAQKKEPFEDFGIKKGTIYAFWRKKRNHLRIFGAKKGTI